VLTIDRENYTITPDQLFWLRIFVNTYLKRKNLIRITVLKDLDIFVSLWIRIRSLV